MTASIERRRFSPGVGYHYALTAVPKASCKRSPVRWKLMPSKVVTGLPMMTGRADLFRSPNNEPAAAAGDDDL